MDPLAQLKLRFDQCVSVENLFLTLPLLQPSNLAGFKIKIWSVFKIRVWSAFKIKVGSVFEINVWSVFKLRVLVFIRD